MSDLSLDTNSALSEWVKKQREQGKVENPDVAVVDEVEDLVKKIDSSTQEPPKEEPKAIEPVAEAEVKPKEVEEESTDPKTVVEPEFNWDEGVAEVAVENKASTLDIKKLGSALELDVNTEEELVSTVKQQVQRLKELEAQNPLEGVPQELKEALDLAKQGGDWQSFIGNQLVDVNRLDPIDLFEQEYEKQNVDRFTDAQGVVNWEALDEEMDAIPQGVKTMQGNNIRDRIYLMQQQKKESLQKVTAQSQEAFNKRLSEAVKELPTYFPKETFGINIEPKHVASVFDGVTSGKLTQKHLGVDTQTLIKAGVDPKKLAPLLAKAEWGEGIAKFQFNQGKTQAKRELLERTQNAQITTPGVAAKPDPSEAEKPKTPAEKIADQMARLRPPNSL